ncbi:MAG: transporter substrate-binding domain-containing protein [Propionibacteriaceae bacterium]|nr:transporter substrate-binding domain-containing protein [Propionibacteriaceae bacterium]
MKKKILLTTVAALVFPLLLTACGGGGGDTIDASGLTTIESGKLTTCSDVPYPPFEIEDTSSPTGYSGFDIEIADAIAKKLGLELAVKDVDFDALQSGTVLVAGECDLGTSAITITEERKANIDFTDSYYDSLQSLLVKADSGYKTLADLKDKVIGVQQGTTGLSYATEHAPSPDLLQQFPSDGELWPAMTSGQIDAILQDQPVNHQHEVDDPNYVIVEEYQTDEHYGFALAKDKNPELLKAINEALAAIKADGTYDTLYAKYFGEK